MAPQLLAFFWEIVKEFSFSDSLLRVEEQLFYMRKPNETNNEVNKKLVSSKKSLLEVFLKSSTTYTHDKPCLNMQINLQLQNL